MKRLGLLLVLALVVGCDGSITNVSSGTGGDPGDDLPDDPADPTPPGDPTDPGNPDGPGEPDPPGDPDDPGDPGDDPDDPPPPPPPPPANGLAAGASIRDVVVYQTVAISVVSRGQLVPTSQRNATVIAGADAIIGIGVDVEAGFTARQVEAVITMGGQEFTETLNLSRSTGSLPSDGYTIQVDGSAFTAGGQFAVELREVSDTAYPGSTDGAELEAQPLGIESSNGPLQLVLVPFRYNADGSGRLPPIDAATVEAYREDFLAMFPVAEVNVTVRDPVNYNSVINGSAGWNDWLDALTDLRRADGVASNVYYYGIAAPAPDFRSFCSRSCILGLGWVPGATNSFLFASVGASFPGSPNVGTGLHEVGHTMGRQHSPCGGVSGADPGYPYAGGRIGVWGYNSADNQLIDPSVGTDIMGYCRDQWISDYVYESLFQRVSRVNTLRAALASEARSYRVGLVDETGAVTWKRTTTLERAAVGNERAVEMLDGAGFSMGSVQGHFFGYDHLPGGMLLVPIDVSFAGPAAVNVEGLGQISW